MFRYALPAFVLLTGTLRSQSFQNNYGAGKYEEGVAVVVDDLAITSVVRHYREGYGYGLQLLRTSLTGTGAVTIDIPLPGAAFPEDAELTPEGDIVLCGSIIPDGRSDHDALLMKVTISGSVLWNWTSNTSDVDERFLGVVLVSGGPVACGTRRAGADSDALLARFDANGALSWQDHYGTPQDDQVSGVAGDANGFVAVGRTVSLAGDADVFTLRTDLLGTQQWSQNWGGIEQDEAASVIARGDGSFVWAGFTNSFPIGDTTLQGDRFKHVYAMAIDANGDSLWSMTQGDALRHRLAFIILEAANDDLLIGGENERDHRSNALALRMNSAGDVLWVRDYALQRIDRLQDLALMPDGGFVGTGKCFAAQGGQVLLLRKNSSGQ